MEREGPGPVARGMRSLSPARSDGTLVFVVLACVFTWGCAAPLSLAWLRQTTPPAHAIPLAGLAAFGPLLAALVVAGRQRTLREVFGRWRTSPRWIALALFAPAMIHLTATALFVAIGGEPVQWFHPPSAPERVAALIVFPLGEELGWRGFAHPRFVERFGLVKGSIALGAIWGLWHLAYSVLPTGGFDGIGFAMGLAELPLYSLLIAWIFERAGRSMAVAIAFHAGGHLDHIELASRADMRLHALHLLVLAVVAAIAARSLTRAAQPALA